MLQEEEDKEPLISLPCCGDEQGTPSLAIYTNAGALGAGAMTSYSVGETCKTD